MAKKSSGTTKDAATTKKASPKAGMKKTAVKKAAAPKAETASKSGTPKATTKKSAAPTAPKAAVTKKAAPKKAAVMKLNPLQLESLKKVKDAGEGGYSAGQKVEERTLVALSTRKLVKKGPKNKATGAQPYLLTKLGEKHLSTTASAPAEKASASA